MYPSYSSRKRNRAVDKSSKIPGGEDRKKIKS